MIDPNNATLKCLSIKSFYEDIDVILINPNPYLKDTFISFFS